MDELKRLDVILCDKFSLSRENAKEAIQKGEVTVNGKICTKCGMKLSEENDIKLAESLEINKFVSRGGFKLEQAFHQFGTTVENDICLDVGSSTGGFTQYLLLSGAKKIYSVDTGRLQLHETLRNNEKVVNLESTNINSMIHENLGFYFDFVTVDVSFVSLTKVLPAIYNLLKENGEGIFLIKPQFEVGKDNLNKKGVIKDLKIHKKTIIKLMEFFGELGFQAIDICTSSTIGHAGNVEYLVHVKKTNELPMQSQKIAVFLENMLSNTNARLKL